MLLMLLPVWRIHGKIKAQFKAQLQPLITTPSVTVETLPLQKEKAASDREDKEEEW